MTSTITLDALALKRPIINLGFDVVGAYPPLGTITRFYDYNHIRDLVRQVCPPIAKSVDDVVAFVRRCMAGDRDTGADMNAFERCYVPEDSNTYPHVVRETVIHLLQRPAGESQWARAADPGLASRSGAKRGVGARECLVSERVTQQ